MCGQGLRQQLPGRDASYGSRTGLLDVLQDAASAICCGGVAGMVRLDIARAITRASECTSILSACETARLALADDWLWAGEPQTRTRGANDVANIFCNE